MTQLHPYINRRKSVVYDGTNGTAIQNLFAPGDFVIIDDDGTTLQFEYMQAPGEVGVGGRILTSNQDHVAGAVVAEDFDHPYLDLPEPALVERVGTAALSAQGALPGLRSPITVTLASEMQAEEWEPDVSLRGTGGLLSGHSIAEVEVTGPDTVEVTIYSGALAPACTIRVVGREVV